MALVVGAAVGLLTLSGRPAQAQLEVLLRGVEATQPQPGRCGRYRFEAHEPTGTRIVEFDVCIESVADSAAGGDGLVTLHLWAGDSLDARVQVRGAMFTGTGGSLLEHVVAVEQTEHGETTRLTPDDWQGLPALSPAPKLPTVHDSTLAPQQHAATGLECRGRIIEEARSSQRTMGQVEVTQSEQRLLEVWSAEQAPIMGVVRAVATVRSERIFSRPIPGVPQRGPRESTYRLELLEFRPEKTGTHDKSSR